MSFFNDFAASAAKKTLNSSYLKPYGTLTRLEIDAEKKTLFVAMELNGETQPIEIRVNHYELVDRDGGTFMEIEGVETSREWVNTLLREHLMEKLIKPKLRETPLPSMVRMLL